MKTRIKIFFVTYQENSLLNETLDSFNETGGFEFCEEVVIINNHSDFFLKDDYIDKVKVIHNNARPDFSTGHLSRNWNQCILHGFKNLNSPDCDILICSQNDVKFVNGWTDKILKIHTEMNIDFFSTGVGDCFCSYTPNAIKSIGLWDERYCGIGFQEADYFIRAIYHLQKKCSINDFEHYRVYNSLSEGVAGLEAYKKIGICYKSNYGEGQNEHHKLSGLYGHPLSHSVFLEKFKVGLHSTDLAEKMSINNESIYSGKLKTSILYPYFELDIPDRQNKNYMN